MPKLSTQEALRHLGGSEIEIRDGLREFAKSARVASAPKTLRKYAKRWVAIYKSRIIGSNTTFDALLEELKAKNVSLRETAIRYIDDKKVAMIL